MVTRKLHRKWCIISARSELQKSFNRGLPDVIIGDDRVPSVRKETKVGAKVGKKNVRSPMTKKLGVYLQQMDFGTKHLFPV